MNTLRINVEIPEQILLTLNLNEDEFSQQMKIFTAAQLYKQHKLSLGQTAALAKMNRFRIIEELEKFGIDIINYDPEELSQELENF
ncbi:MAG: hypothetical protein COW85_14060 [Ignavibacteria bacterium CG22_combo_CG10-13_8_21_14_all_37_15]|jgi:predicted HTH domain antitoxin|nr:UPF0175 family protein [Ignavibacteria bacterium]OIO22153.1 MAG: hypothetical protein AUJ54_03990 [Ignavibacteria bacterium CG1_02_37_35]PIP76462.1 MAG: hypothetical protein COW85_14060 [Ignavibacteria bacterium CG22_combo_CG10-13_8_21_14_all_37_15]PIS45198.1 MAG: hypothetical protein COT22_06460 [Ignavibacteria bacterium CG08_land_8_20_14_0_20_37_9]PIX94790.1 MAG: hypothetical protein COZ25_03710 [Ignavibacteria bacterium CG_4_10_14_3_um_filter_37_18]PJC57040.1 MAG: hypothetical protein CO